MKKQNSCVLISTEIMGIGGAETHIYELCSALLKNNHKVVLVSSGGVLADKLEEIGVVKYDVPIRQKNIYKLITSYFKIIEIVRNEKPDVIHAHSRIAAYIFNSVSKLFNIPFVTTDHARFSTSNPILHRMTKWGSKTLAVSEDLKQYLLDNYKIKSEDIFLTINAIDADKFKNRSDDITLKNEMLSEYGIENHEKIILSVSRLDTTAYLCAYELLESAKELYTRHPDSRLVIIGGGDVFDDVKSKADKINSELGKEYIVLTGPRSDIYKFCGICDVFVGCARSAIEALFCEKPCIVAGNGGYLGIVSDDNLDFCLSSNFTARGIDTFPVEQLIDDISYCLDNRVGSMRDFVCANYSLERMRDDAEMVYFKAQCESAKHFDAALAGYYGHGNMGDDSMVTAIINNLRKKDKYLKICVMCRKAGELAQTLKGMDVAVKERFNIFDVYKSIKRSDTLILGGGTLLQDNTSTKSLIYYTCLIHTAHRLGKKIMIYANGLGPIRKKKNMLRAARALEKCDIITLRDYDSKAMADSMNLKNKNITVTADEALTSQLPSPDIMADSVVKFGLDGKRYAVISLRRWKNTSDEIYNKIIAATKAFCEKYGFIPVFAVMENEHDLALTEKAKRICSGISVNYIECPQETISLTLQADFVISMRLHTLVFSALGSVPCCGIAYDPKVYGFMKTISRKDDCIGLKDFDGRKFNEILERVVNDASYREEMRARMNYLKKNASQNADIAYKLIEK